MQGDAVDREFVERRKQELEAQRDELLEALELEREAFEALVADQDPKDRGDMATIKEDSDKIGMLRTQDKERLRTIAAALYRIDQDRYGVCESCGGEIARERLEAMPDAILCFSCQKRLEEERRRQRQGP
jgi:DnaK suppressor protein